MEPGTGDSIDMTVALTAPGGGPVSLPRSSLELTSSIDSLMVRVPEVESWDAEHPRLYTLTCRLSAGSSALEELEAKVGFRRITFGGKEGTNPRKVYVNGKPIKPQGMNLHDYSLEKGRSTTAQINERDVAQLKGCNVNHIRTSHYPPPRALVEACDRYGIYLEVETAICFQHGILDQPQIETYRSRFIEMVEANRNHASVLIWSLGNESSWNQGISAEYDWIKENDPAGEVQLAPNHFRRASADGPVQRPLRPFHGRVQRDARGGSGAASASLYP